eukprot:scaffold9695_cov31-Tisochrysis_lutea.AAC.4
MYTTCHSLEHAAQENSHHQRKGGEQDGICAAVRGSEQSMWGSKVSRTVGAAKCEQSRWGSRVCAKQMGQQSVSKTERAVAAELPVWYKYIRGREQSREGSSSS